MQRLSWFSERTVFPSFSCGWRVRFREGCAGCQRYIAPVKTASRRYLSSPERRWITVFLYEAPGGCAAQDGGHIPSRVAVNALLDLEAIRKREAAT